MALAHMHAQDLFRIFCHRVLPSLTIFSIIKPSCVSVLSSLVLLSSLSRICRCLYNSRWAPFHSNMRWGDLSLHRFSRRIMMELGFRCGYAYYFGLMTSRLIPVDLDRRHILIHFPQALESDHTPRILISQKILSCKNIVFGSNMGALGGP